MKRKRPSLLFQVRSHGCTLSPSMSASKSPELLSLGRHGAGWFLPGLRVPDFRERILLSSCAHQFFQVAFDTQTYFPFDLTSLHAGTALGWNIYLPFSHLLSPLPPSFSYQLVPLYMIFKVPKPPSRPPNMHHLQDSQTCILYSSQTVWTIKP